MTAGILPATGVELYSWSRKVEQELRPPERDNQAAKETGILSHFIYLQNDLTCAPY